jgi:hypothetical protein
MRGEIAKILTLFTETKNNLDKDAIARKDFTITMSNKFQFV